MAFGIGGHQGILLSRERLLAPRERGVRPAGGLVTQGLELAGHLGLAVFGGKGLGANVLLRVGAAGLKVTNRVAGGCHGAVPLLLDIVQHGFQRLPKAVYVETVKAHAARGWPVLVVTEQPFHQRRHLSITPYPGGTAVEGLDQLGGRAVGNRILLDGIIHLKAIGSVASHSQGSGLVENQQSGNKHLTTVGVNDLVIKTSESFEAKNSNPGQDTAPPTGIRDSL